MNDSQSGPTDHRSSSAWSTDEPGFPAVRLLGEGYAADEVDAFVAELRRAARQDPPAMAPYEVADARFKVARVGRRYPLREVDDYLDAAQGALRERLRERHGEDAVAEVEGRPADERHVSTLWIYLVGAVVVVAVVVFALTQF